MKYTAADIDRMLGKAPGTGQSGGKVTADDVNRWIREADEEQKQARANSEAIRQTMNQPNFTAGGTAGEAVPLSANTGDDYRTWVNTGSNRQTYDALNQAIRKNRVAELYNSGAYTQEALDEAYRYIKETPTAGQALISGAESVGKSFVGNIATVGEGITNIQQMKNRELEELERIAKEQAAGRWNRDTEQTKEYLQRFHESQGRLLSDNSFGAEMSRQAAQDWQEATKGIKTQAGLTAADFARDVAGNLPSYAANLVLPGSGLALMAASAAGDKIRELDERGVEAGEALIRGAITGGIEAATEKLPLDNWMDIVTKGGGKRFVLEMLKNMGVEGGEEAAGYVMNWIADKAFQDPEARFSVKELLQTALMGAASGGVYAGLGKGLNTLSRAAGGNLMQSIDTEAVQGQIGENLKQAGVDADQQTARNMPQEARNIAGNILAGEAGKPGVQGQPEPGKPWIPPIETELERFVKKSMQTQLKNKAMENGTWKKETFEAIDKLSKKSGLAVEYINDPAAAQQGQDAYIRGKTMTLNLASDTAGVSSAIHETIHAMKAGNNGKAYQDFRDMIWRYVDRNSAMLQLAADVEATYTAKDSPALRSITNEDGSINRALLDEEITCKLAEELCGNPDALVEAVAEDRSMIRQFLDFIRGIKNSIAIGLTNSQRAMLDESERRLVNLLRGEAGEVGGERYSIEKDNQGNQYVNITEDILKGVPKEQASKVIKEYLSGAYPNGFVWNGWKIEFTRKGRNEFLRSKDTQLNYNRADESRYMDKMRMARNLDEIVQIADNIRNENIKHKRKDSISSFNRADVSVKVGKNGYSAEVITAIYPDTKEIFYDIVRIQPKKIEGNPDISTVQNESDARLVGQPSDVRLSHEKQKVNEMFTGDNKSSLRTTKTADTGGARTWAEYQKWRAAGEVTAAAGEQGSGKTTQTTQTAQQTEQTAGKPAESGDLQSSAKSDGQDIEGLWQTKKSKANQSRMENRAVERIADTFEVPKGEARRYLKSIVHELAQEMKRTGDISTETADRLFNEAYESGIHVEEDFYNQYKELKDFIKNSTVKMSQTAGALEKDTRKEMTRHRWMKFGEDGVELDTFYQELSEKAPTLFPEDIYNPDDQLLRIRDVVKSIEVSKINLDAYYGQDAEDFKAWARQGFDGELENLKADIAHIARAEKDNWAARQEKERQAGAPMTVEQATAQWKKVQDLEKKAAKAVSKTSLTRADNAIVDRLLKGETTLADIENTVDPQTYDDIERVYNAKREVQEAGKGVREYGKQLAQNRLDRASKALEGSELWTDKGIGTTRYDTTTPLRNLRDISKKGGQAAAQAVYEGYFEPVIDNTTKKIRWQKKWNKAVNDLKLNQWESQYLQIWGELKGIDEAVAKGLERNQSEKNTLRLELDKLIEEHGDKVDRKKVEGEAYEVFRNFYDEAYRMTNEALVRNGYQPMEYRAGYFPHFNDQKPDGFWRKTAAKLGFGTAADNLPTAIAGTTDTRKPGRRYNQFNQRRTGYNTEYNALKGFERYIDVAGDSIFHGDDIRNLRALESAIRYKYSDEGIRQRIEEIYNNDSLTESERENLLTEAWETNKTHMSNFVQWVNEYTNLLAGKKDRFSRAIEQQFGRGIYRSTRTVQNRLAGAQIAGNISSAMTNFIPISQLTAEVSTKNIVQAMAQTVKAGIQGDDLSELSDFIARREGAGSIKKGIMDTVSDVAGKGFEIVDGFASNVVVRAKYLQNIQNGMSAEMAMSDADSYAAGLMADRSQGSLPTIYQKNNPLMKMFTLYQVEVKNQFDYMIKDLPVNVKNRLGTEDRKRIIANVAWGLTKTAIWAYLLNDLYEILTGRRPALDPLDILNEAVGDYAGYKLPNTWEELGKAIHGEASLKDIEARKKKKSAAAFNLAENVAEEVPFIGGMLGGGRIPMVSSFDNVKDSLTTLAENVADGDTAGMKKQAGKAGAALIFTFAPGGGQLKKTFGGAQLAWDGGLYTGSGDTRRLRTPAEMSPVEIAQAAIFGKGANKDVRAYYESGDDGLSAKQTVYWENGTEDFPAVRDTGVSFKVFNSIMDFNSKATSDKDEAGKTIEGSKRAKVDAEIMRQLKEDGFEGDDLKETRDILMKACGYTVKKYESLTDTQAAYWETGSKDKKNPFRSIQSTGISLEGYTEIAQFAGKAEASKDINGVAISGSRKEKIVAKINQVLKKEGFEGDKMKNTREVLLKACGYK